MLPRVVPRSSRLPSSSFLPFDAQLFSSPAAVISPARHRGTHSYTKAPRVQAVGRNAARRYELLLPREQRHFFFDRLNARLDARLQIKIVPRGAAGEL